MTDTPDTHHTQTGPSDTHPPEPRESYFAKQARHNRAMLPLHLRLWQHPRSYEARVWSVLLALGVLIFLAGWFSHAWWR